MEARHKIAKLAHNMAESVQSCQLAELEQLAKSETFVFLTRDSEAAKDLAQDTALATLAAIRGGAVRVSVKHYAYQVARFQWIQVLRQKSRERQHEPLPPDVPARAETTTLPVFPVEKVLAILRARHSPRHARVLSLLLAGETPEAVREKMGLTVTQYRLTKNRALAAARRIAQGIHR